MELLTDMTEDFIEGMRERYPEKVEAFLENVAEEFSFFLTDKEAKEIVDKMENESKDYKGKYSKEKWYAKKRA